MTERAFDHVVIVLFENEYRSYVRANQYMRTLAESGTELAASFGVSHPSHANYVASIAGQLCNVSADPIFNSFVPCAPSPTTPAPLQETPIVDRIRAKGLRWKAYMEGYQPVVYPPQLDLVMDASTSTVDVEASVRSTILDYLPYMNMHNPFVRFQSVMNDPDQWACIRPLYELFTDVLDGTLPECSWVVPTLWGDGHYLWGSVSEPPSRAPGLVDQQARWLETLFGVLGLPGNKSRLPKRTLVIVTYDEADFEHDYIQAQGDANSYDGPNQIFTVLLGDVVEAGRVEHQACNHYTILRTIERNFGLDDLGANDKDANWLQFLWGRSFQWSAPRSSPIEGATAVAAAGRGVTLDVLYATADGVRHRASDGLAWSAEEAIAAPAGVSALAACAIGETLLLVTQSDGALQAMTLTNGTWSEAQTIVADAADAFALAAYVDRHDGATKAMLAWCDATGAVQSQIFAANEWSSPVAVGQQTDGGLTLAVLGASLFLIAKTAGADTMSVVSYNTADCNVITGTKNGDSDTTRGMWSPSAFPVAHFGRGPRDTNDGELEPALRKYRAAAPYATATLDGVVHLMMNEVEDARVLTTTFALSGMLTPKNPVNYASGSTGSNGYGTLAQGGWTLPLPMAGLTKSNAMAMARFGDQIALLTQSDAGAALQLSIGSYVRAAEDRKA